MKRKKLNEKGVTLISLAITITVIMIITGTIIYNVKDNLKVQKLEQMQQDIENLSEKINTYYAQYGKIPAKLDAEYTNISGMQEANVISSAVDTGKFYVIDLEAIENLTLTYGQDYETVKSLTNASEINNYDNLYIINESSHNIFYPRGIEIDGKWYYTTYTEEGVDTEAVELHYVDNIEIPDGYKYISGTKNSGIIIENETTNEQYKWIVLDTEITELPDGIVVEDEAEFLNSVNVFDGYYQGIEDETKVEYLLIEEKWSLVYDANGKYVDENGDTAIIPAGFKVSKTPGMDTINDGLVIQDEEGNEFVWIPVTSEDEYVRNTTYAYTDVSAAAYTDNGYLPEGIQPTIEASITDVEEIGLINEEAEREAVVAAGGFYIGRYEAGDSSATADRTSAIDGTLVSKKNVYAYNYISQEDAKEKAKTFKNNDNVKSALISGIQWDVTMATINGKLDGNNQTYDVTSPADDATTSDRHTGNPATTGQNIADKVYNIYDLEGNLSEYVAEKNTYHTDLPYVNRGGSYNSSGSTSTRGYWDGNAFDTCVFRLVLYVMEN